MTSALRRWLIALGVLALLVAAVLLALGWLVPLAIDLIVTGVVLVAALVFERRGYRPPVDRAHGRWQATGERFVDPTTGHLIEVRYDPVTGQRDYVDLGSP